MQLILLLAIPFGGGLLCCLAERIRPGGSRIMALITALALIGVTLSIGLDMPTAAPTYFLVTSVPWIPSAGIRFTLAMDGLSFLLIALSALLNIIAVGCSWSYIREKQGGFYLCLLWVIGGTMGVFLAHDLFLFYFFWELMLVPMYFLIGIWGHDEGLRVKAAIKFFLFTFISGLFLLASILALYWIHGRATGVYTFDYHALLMTPLTATEQTWILAGFFIGFGVKLPAFGVHTWLPDAHTQAPTGGSIDLAGLLLKTGAYGFIRFAMPFCPEAWLTYGFLFGVIGVIGIFYGAIMAFAQTDLKRLVAYSSISHMGFVLLALAANNTISGQGAILQMICHGLSSAALFAVVGMIDERFHTRNIKDLGGLWAKLPRLSGFVIFFSIASLGIPGMGNFIAELLTLVGSYEVWPSLAIAATIGLFFSAVYSLKFIGKSVYGPLKVAVVGIRDLDKREWSMLVPLCVLLIWLGLAPGYTLQMTEAWWRQPTLKPVITIEAEPGVEESFEVEPQHHHPNVMEVQP